MAPGTPSLKASDLVSIPVGEYLCHAPPQPVKLTPLACRTTVADLVVGVSTAVYRTFSSRAEAVAAYDTAVRKGEVSEL